ncbi:hypothetical protein [Agriterribacter humi]|uniref:hypothetical protein n=1 Tax=Agriterribacter humi TaxID=1104781 RepID=UPI00126550B3|nr:hypothetical protein [Agriterribacter humi]
MEKLPNKILGFINQNGIDYPFSYIEPVLHLLPPSHEDWNRKKRLLISELEKLQDNQPNNKWSESRFYKGVTNRETDVIFKTKETVKNDNGFEAVEVENIFEYSKGDDKDAFIYAIAVHSDELEYFHNITNRSVNRFSPYHNQLTPHEHHSATASDSITPLGSFIDNDIKLDFELEIYSVYNIDHVAGGIRKKKTMLRVMFDKPIGFQRCLEVLHYVRQFIKFICYRSNVNLRSVTTLRRDKDNLLVYSGRIFTLNRYEEEKSSVKERRIITYDLIHSKIINLLEAVSKDEILFSHFCINIDSQKSYSPSRAILIFAAFEKEYSYFFSESPIRSAGYLITKDKAIMALSEIKTTLNSKGRKYVERFISIIDNSDSSLDARIKKALKKYQTIISPFLFYFYGIGDDEIIEAMPERICLIRNAFAHGNLGVTFLPIHLSDLKILEILLYVMRLDALAVDHYSIAKAIQQVFGINPN